MIWIFGYGSLIWRPAFNYVEAKPGFVRGWARRFWQASTDHRGVPEAPGRVVTLVQQTAHCCWGVGSALRRTDAGAVLERLDHREKGGYDRHEVEIELADSCERGVMYVAGPQNPNYLGPAPLPAIAETVRSASGPSGDNVEYVMRLADALREMGAEDEHVFELARLVGG